MGRALTLPGPSLWPSLWAAGAGDDSLWGGAGRDVLHAGPGTNLVDDDGVPPGTARIARTGLAIPPPRKARR